FSVLARNLVPSCSKCNRLKSNKWLRGGIREIISLYYDDLPVEQYLNVDVSFPKNDRAKVSFKLQRPAGISKPLYRRLTRQFEILELISRYNKAGVWHVSEANRSSKGKSRAAIKKWFETDIRTQTTLCGVNHYKAVLYGVLAESEEFMTLVGAT